MRGIVYGMALSMMMWVAGCATMKEAWMRGYVIVHEAADKALEGQTNAPALPPILTPDKPATGEQGCVCDQKATLCDAPYSAKWLDEQGNATECPVPHGMDIRGKTLYPSCNQRYSLHLLPKMVSSKQADGMVYGKCPVVDGYQYHFEGYSRQGETEMTPAKAGELFKYTYKMKVWHNVRKVKQ